MAIVVGFRPLRLFLGMASAVTGEGIRVVEKKQPLLRHSDLDPCPGVVAIGKALRTAIVPQAVFRLMIEFPRNLTRKGDQSLQPHMTHDRGIEKNAV